MLSRSSSAMPLSLVQRAARPRPSARGSRRGGAGERTDCGLLVSFTFAFSIQGRRVMVSFLNNKAATCVAYLFIRYILFMKDE